MRVIPIPCSFDNYSYLLVCEVTGEAAVIDPTEAYPVNCQIEDIDVNLTSVLCTHHHNDHVGAIGELLETSPQLKVYCHHSDRERIPLANTYIEDGDTISVGKLEGRSLHTPGHTLGSICYHFEETLFTGDTLFGSGCGRLFEGTAEQMYVSLTTRIAVLPAETKLFFGHEYTLKNLEFSLSVEPQNSSAAQRLKILQEEGGITTPTTLKAENETNPFLRCSSKNICNNLVLRGMDVKGELEVFAALRELRNSF